MRCAKKFLYYFRKGFADPKYISWERQYKLDAHLLLQEKLNKPVYEKILKAEKYKEIASTAIQLESRTNLLFSFEKMAIRDAVKTEAGAKLFAMSLFSFVYDAEPMQQRFEKFVQTANELPRIQTRVLTWPLVTVFGFIANPKKFIFLKPRVTQAAALKY